MSSRNDRTTFEGRRTTVRTVAMLKEARVIFKRRTGKNPPAISQGGYNAGGVAASAGTHDRDALDFATSGWSDAMQKEWELALWMVGFAAWWRRYIYNVWPAHNHAIPKGGDLSRGAAAQERSFRAKRNGLAGNGSYPRIGSYAGRTWEDYLKIQKEKAAVIAKAKAAEKKAADLLKNRPLAALSIGAANKARKGGYISRYSYLVQIWLSKMGYYKGTKDGKWGVVTEAAFNAWRKKEKIDPAKGAFSATVLEKIARKNKNELRIVK